MSELAFIRKAERLLRDKWAYSSEYDISDRVLSGIHMSSSSMRKSVTWVPGVSVGLILIASLFLVNFSDTFAWVEIAMGDVFVIPVNIVLGLILSAYIAAFIASQISRLSSYMHPEFKNHSVKR